MTNDVSHLDADLERYQGQWGTQLESGEEMWWSSVNPKLKSSWYARFRFFIDARHFFLIRFLKKAHQSASSDFRAIDFGCGTGGTTLNFSNYLGFPITGYDVYETQLQIARKLNQKVQGQCDFKM